MPWLRNLVAEEKPFMRGKGLLILFLIAAAVGTYLYFGIEKASEKEAAQKEEDAQLAQGDLLLLTSFSLKNDKAEFEVIKKGENWWISSPTNDLAAQNSVDSFISALERFKTVKIIAEKTEKSFEASFLEQFGLKKASLSIKYKTSDQTKAIQLTLGRQNPKKTGTYSINPSNGDIVLASMNLDSYQTQSPNAFREMKIVTVDSSYFTEVSFTHMGKEISFVKNKNKEWEMLSPYKLPIDQAFTRGVFKKISLIRANEFVKAMPKALRKATVDTKIVVGFEENVKDKRSDETDKRPNGVEIILGKAKENKTDYEYYAKTDKTLPARIAQYHYENFTKSPEDFIRKDFKSFLVSEITKTSIKTPKAKMITIQKLGEAYDVSQAKVKKPGLKEKVEESISSLRNMKAIQFLGTFKTAPKVYDLQVKLERPQTGSLSFTIKDDKLAPTLWFEDGNLKMKYLLKQRQFKPENFKFETLTASLKENETKAENIKPDAKTNEK